VSPSTLSTLLTRRETFCLPPVDTTSMLTKSIMNTFNIHTAMLRAMVFAVSLAGAGSAFAHAHPVTQTPAAGSTVSVAQKQLAIDFDDGLEPAFSSITVTDAQGKSVTSGKAVVDPSNKKHMSVGLNALTPGVYTVAWIAVATDGHRTQGHYTFTVK
jgi:methionine-rich copper-binding protein CopC